VTADDGTRYGANHVEPHPNDCNISGAVSSAISDTDFPVKMASKKLNKLYFGDNRVILRDHIASESVDLVYLDPPFNCKRDYNLIFKESGGKRATSQELFFGDTWIWSEKADETCRELIESGGKIAEVIRAFRSFLGTSDMMAYIAMMAPRLIELRRVLKETGSIYLHCDPNASHYLKILMDAVFGGQNFKNEITWKRTFAHGNVSRNYGSVSDVLLWYTKSDDYTWNQPYKKLSEAQTLKKYPHVDPDGRRWQSVTLRNPGSRPNLHYPYKASNGITYSPHRNGWSCNLIRMRKYDDEGRLHFPTNPTGALRLKMYANESPGEKLQNIWDDIPPISALAQERLGYPTQKPEALLRRIIEACSNEGDLVLDPFCGCGTAIEVAQHTERRWIGIDVTHLSLATIKGRLVKEFGPDIFKNIEVVGEPVTEEEALALAASDKFGFQCWVVGRLGAPPIEQKKGADRGIDGRIYFHDDLGAPKHIVISVKAGDHIGPAFVRELRGVVDREKAEMGILVCVKEPTSEMKKEAAQLGWYKSLGGNFPRMQIITLKDIFANNPLNVPVKRINPYERKGPQSVRPLAEQLRLLP